METRENERKFFQSLLFGVKKKQGEQNVRNGNIRSSELKDEQVLEAQRGGIT